MRRRTVSYQRFYERVVAAIDAGALDGGPLVSVVAPAVCSTKGPSWFDAAYFHRVMRAGTRGARLPRGAAMPKAAGLAYPGIRPGLWLVTFIDYDLGYIDLEQRNLQPIDNPFGPRLSPMS